MPIDTHKSNETLTKLFRDRLRDSLHTALRTQTNTLIKAPTGLGKTHEVATTPWRTHPDIVGSCSDLATPLVHVSPSTTARDQAYEKSRQAGVNPHILRGRQEACPVAKGDYDEILTVPPNSRTPSEWFNLKCDVQGVPFSIAHDKLKEILGGLPCLRNGACKGATQWVPMLDGSADEFDIVHVTDTFVYHPDLIRNCNVIFDEQPRYIKHVQKHVTRKDQIGRVLTHEHIRNSVTRFLKTHVDEALNNWEGLISAVNAQDRQTLKRFQKIIDEADFDSSWYLNSKDVHISTRALIQAIINAKKVGNGYLRGEATVTQNSEWFDSDNSSDVVSRQIVVIIDKHNDIKLIHEPPNLSATRCVIGLDAHPTERLWRMNTLSELQFDDLDLTMSELQQWRQTERGLTVYQVDTHTRQYTSGWAGDSPKDRKRTRRRAKALIKAIHQKHGRRFRTAITSSAIRDDVKQMMEVVGIPDPDVLYYGNLRSRGDFEDETIGLLIGCIDPGDHNIMTTLALLDLYATPSMVENEEGEVVREPGRTFEGPDADAATEVLESVREMNVAQAIGRYARRADRQDSHATVYVWTDAITPDLRDEIVPGVRKIPINKQKMIIDTLCSSSNWMTALEIKKTVLENYSPDTLTKEHIRQTMIDLESRGAVHIQKGTGYNGADEYQMDSDSDTSIVELMPESV